MSATWQVTGNGISYAIVGWPRTLETVSVTGSSYQSQRNSSFPLGIVGKWWCLHVSEALFIFHHSLLFLFFRLYNLNWPSLHLLILSSAHSIMLWASLLNFSFHLVYFSTEDLLLSSFYKIIYLYWYFYLAKYHSHLLSFSSLDIVSFSSSNTLKMTWSLCLVNPMLWLPRGQSEEEGVSSFTTWKCK